MTASSKIRIYDLAKELRIDTKRLINELQNNGVQISIPSNSISKTLAQQIRSKYGRNTQTDRKSKGCTKSAVLSNDSKIVGQTRSCALCDYSPQSRSALNIHLLKDHVRALTSGELRRHFSVSELTTGLAVKKERICEAAWRFGHQLATESHLVEPDFLPEMLRDIQAYKEGLATIADKLSPDVLKAIEDKNFRELREIIDSCLRGGSVSTDDEFLVTNNRQKLRLYARMLELKAYDKKNANIAFRKRVITRIIEDIEVFETRRIKLIAKRLPWKLLPSGKLSFQSILDHFRFLSRHRALLECDIDRLHKIYGLGPDQIYVGEAEFDGYLVFYFCDGPAAVLDCPILGNAIYVFGYNWKKLSRFTKTDLIHSRRLDFDRIIHKNGWFARLKFVITKRGVRLSKRDARMKETSGRQRSHTR